MCIGVRLENGRSKCNATRICMFDDHRCRTIESTHQLPSSFGIKNVEIRHLFPIELRCGIPPTLDTWQAVTGTGLMRIFAVAQYFGTLRNKSEDWGHRCIFAIDSFVCEPRCNRGVVGTRDAECFLSEAATCRNSEELSLDHLEHICIISRIDNYSDVRKILCSSTHHRRPTDVDQVDTRL